MNKLILSAALAAAFALAPAAYAADTNGGNATQTASTTKAKHDDCMKQWRAEKKHTGTQKAFLAACEKKG
jgi:Ni/Co efflux regulator RcnB